MGEAPHNMVGWGPICTGYPWWQLRRDRAGILPPGLVPDRIRHCARIEPWADIDLDFGPAGGTKTLWVRYLDGGSTDRPELFHRRLVEIGTYRDRRRR